MCLIIYDEDDSIITILETQRAINAFINGHLTIKGYNHYEIV